MGKPKTSETLISRAQELRRTGRSLPEIKKLTGLGFGTVFRYTQGIEILPEYKKFWTQKRGGNVRKKLNEPPKRRLKFYSTLMTTINSCSVLHFTGAKMLKKILVL